MVNLLLSLIKLLIAVVIIPIVIAVTSSFIEELRTIDPDVGIFFLTGVLAYLAVYLLAFQLQRLYQGGQKFLQVIFGFSQVFAKAISFILPIYAVILLAAYLIAGLFGDAEAYLYLLVALVGFFVTLHFILGAQELKAGQADLLKANYIASLLFIWTFCIIISAVMLYFAKTGFYFNEFVKNAYDAASEIYLKLWRQLF